MNLEEAVRTTVREMADDAPPAKNLAHAARRRGRRLRRRRRATAVLAIALIAVTLSVSLVPRHRRPDTLPQTTEVPSPADPADWWKTPYPLPGGAIVTALSRRDVGGSEPGGRTVRDGNVLLNRATGQYVMLPASYYTIFGAPVGERAVVSDGEGGSGIVDASGGRIWRDLNITPDWSADGSRVLFDTDTGYAVMDVATGAIASHDTLDAIALCPDVCRFSWLPGEREVAVAQRDPAVEQSASKPDKIKNIAIYDAATAKRLRTVPVAGVPVRQDAWSPDGTLVLLEDQPGQAHPVADVATGRIVTWLPVSNPHFLPSGLILAFSNLEAVLFDTGGNSLAIQGLPYDFTDRQISVGQP